MNSVLPEALLLPSSGPGCLVSPAPEQVVVAGAGRGPAEPIRTGRSSSMLRGRCNCKTVCFEVADEFVVAYNCHCSNCRATTGSAFLPWGEIEPEKLKVTRGADSVIVIGDSGGHHAKRCGQCFSLLSWTGYEGRIRVPKPVRQGPD